MTTSLRALRRAVDSVPAPDLDVADLVRRGGRRRRRRRAAAVVGAVAAVVLAVSVGTVLADRDDGAAPPVDRPDRTRTDSAPVSAPARRRLVYADVRDYGFDHGGTGKVHVGAAAIDTGVQVTWLDATDDGAVVTTSSGRIYFTDGTTVREIGTLGPLGYAGYRAGGLVRTGHTGSLAAWFDASVGRRSVLVVYDTSTAEVVARHRVPHCRFGCSVQVVVGDRIYWNQGTIGYGQTDLHDAWVYDLSSGTDSPGTADTLEADVRRTRRGLVLGRSASGTAVISTEFIARDGLLVNRDGGDVFDLATGRPLTLHLPAAYGDATLFEKRKD